MNSNPRLALISLGLSACLLSGCNGQAEPPKIPAVAPGFVKLQSTQADLPKGTQLYNQDGSLFGTVIASDANHVGTEGKPRPAVQVQLAKGSSMWIDKDVLGANQYIKK